MDTTAQELLGCFAQHANCGVLHARDWEMFDAFIGHEVTSGRAAAAGTVCALLREHEWAGDQAERMATLFDGMNGFGEEGLPPHPGAGGTPERGLSNQRLRGLKSRRRISRRPTRPRRPVRRSTTSYGES